MIKKISVLLFSLFLIFVFSSCGTLKQDIAILYTNDIHCAVEADTENGIIGYSKLFKLKSDLEETDTPVILVDAGDAVMGEPIGNISEGENIIKLMNLVCYDYAIPGNHEFDYGMDRFLELAEMADFEYLSCNFKDLEKDNLVFPAYKIEDIGGHKVALIGVTTPASLISSNPTSFMDENSNYVYDFYQDKLGNMLYTQIQKTVTDALKDDADYVILIAHLGIDASCSPWTSSEIIENTTGIDAVIDGHSHSVIEHEYVKNALGEPVLLTSTGTKFANIGKLTISADGNISSQLINENEIYLEESSVINDKIALIKSDFEKEMQQIVASSDTNLVINDPKYDDSDKSVRLIRITETNLGNLCTDAYKSITGADIAIVNGGGIRDSISAGDITYEDIIKVHPFGNYICMIEANGQQILNMLELGARNLPAEDGTFQQVSGITFDIDITVPSSVEIDENGMFVAVNGEYRVKNVKVNGEDLNLNKTYTLASNDYQLKEFGGGAIMFKECTMVLDNIILDNQCLIDYITDTLGGVISEKYSDPYGEGRINIIQ